MSIHSNTGTGRTDMSAAPRRFVHIYYTPNSRRPLFLCSLRDFHFPFFSSLPIPACVCCNRDVEPSITLSKIILVL